MLFNDTICATATAQGTGALGIIRVSGKDAFAVVTTVFKGKNLNDQASHTVHYGFIENKKTGEIIDEVMVSVFKAPKTFTAENLVEITCHGSSYIQQNILSLLLQNGARLATAGEFTQRAFLNGRIDLAQAEAVADLISAENKASHNVALNQMRGGISNELQILREKLIDFTALIELELDFSEEDVAFANRNELEELTQNLKIKIQNLIASFEYGNALKNGVPVAIIGKPNAGKSSLLNTLLKEERAIVSDIAGTTRDAIEEVLVLDGIAFRFIDTAGLRKTNDIIEAIGVERAKEKVRQAKIIIHLYENNIDLLEELQPLLEGKIVFNLMSKTDVNTWGNDKYETYLTEKYPDYYHFGISTQNQFNIENLKQKLVTSIKGNSTSQDIIITNARHKEALEHAEQELENVIAGMQNGLPGDLLAFHLRAVLHHLGTITGKIDVDTDILGTIFGRFCVGK